jgi:leader peptidase (prepilin peptidase)/N-methyltransferase
MFLIYSIFFFVVGAVIGSFLNVVIYRYNTGFGFQGRSECFSCGKTLTWYELVPIFSFITLGGRCSVCKSKISWQYPFVELLTGITFLILFLKSQTLLLEAPGIFFLTMLYQAIIASIFIVILVYDLRHKIIPDGLVFILGILSLAGLFISFTNPISFHLPTFMQFLAGPILAAPFALLWLVSGGRWMGLGDAKLAISMGWLLGIAEGISAVFIAFWIGAVVGLTLILLERLRNSFVDMLFKRLGLGEVHLKSEIPFAPFLILGLVLVFLFTINVIYIG